MALTQTVAPSGEAVHDLGLDALAPGRSFPSADLVAAAAALHVDPQLVPAGLLDGAREGREFFVQVAAGVVGVRLLDHDRTARTAGARRHTPAGWFDAEGVWRTPTPRRVITGWSRKSRANMTRALSELDYAPLWASGRTPAMLTLTYPGDWLAAAPDAATVKRHLRALARRWARTWGQAPAYLWKQEFQRRGAPHLHVFAVPEHGEAWCRCCGRRLDFRTWLGHTWADVVAADDTNCLSCGYACACDGPPDTERRRHRLAGTGVDYREGVRARDPKRLAVYFAKHGAAAGGKEYQHDVPDAWLLDRLGYDARLGYSAPAAGSGRFWGYSGLARVRRETGVSDRTYLAYRRALRRLSEARGLTRDSRVPRGRGVDGATGEITSRRRKVTRRRRHLAAGGLNGGFVLVNDGPALAAALARLRDPAGGWGSPGRWP